MTTSQLLPRVQLAIPHAALLVALSAAPTHAQVVLGNHPGFDPGGGMGLAVAALGDLDGDGRGDVACAAPLEDNTFFGAIDSGVVYVDSGKPFGPASAAWPHLQPITAISTSANGLQLGSALWAADLDLDGVKDLLVGAQGTLSSVGMLQAWSGAALGQAPVVWSWSPGLAGIEFGHAVCSLDDLDGDGRPEIAVGAPSAGFAGSKSGRVYVLSGGLLVQGAPNPVLYTIDGSAPDQWFGFALSRIGDLDGDGLSELLVGAPRSNAFAGLLRACSGATGATLGTLPGAAGEELGWSVAPCGDWNLDGVPDLIVGSPGFDFGPTADVGKAMVVSGRWMVSGAGPLDLHISLGQGFVDERFGHALADVGDLDGDGRTDVAIGAPRPGGSGRVIALRGGSSSVLVEKLGEPQAWYGAALASAGDTNADGRPEILVGAPQQAGVGRMEILAPCPLPDAVYCTAKPNSAGCVPSVATSGASSWSGAFNHFIGASSVINQKLGFLLYGFAPATQPLLGGTLCVAPPITRTAVQSSFGNPGGNDCSGTYSFDFNAWLASGQDPLLKVGLTVYAQYWYRDPLDAFGSGLTDAVHFTICF